MQKVSENEMEFRKGNSGPKYMFRGPKIDWGILVLNPGETLGAHFHERVEETFYFIHGEPIMKVNGSEHRAKKGDAFMLSPGDRHDIINDTDSAVKLIFIKCPFEPEDRVDC